MKSKIALISSDEKLVVKAKQVIEETGEEIKVYHSSLAESEKNAREAIKNGANIIISRGGTAELIKRKLDVPVVKIEINHLDIIKAITKAMQYSNNIGVIGFENLIFNTEGVSKVLKKYLPINISTEIIHDDKKVEEKVLRLINKGAEIFIGVSALKDSIGRHGFRIVTHESGKEAIISAIQSAKHLLEVQIKEKEKAKLLKSIIDFTNSAIVGVDAQGKITVFNSKAESLIGCSVIEAIGKSIEAIMEGTSIPNVLKTGEAELGEFHKIGKASVATNIVPIVVDGITRGAVATIEEIEKIQNIERNIRKKLFLKGHVAKSHFSDIVGKSNAMKRTKERARQFAEVDSTILIIGETGTGKELFVQSIHNASKRFDKPFVAVNCAALPETLLESELFGYVEGAFTGAKKGGRPGLFELAHEGTIFLDEVSEMSPKLQSRFLRVIQEKEVVRIGDNKIIPVNVRVIAASNKNLGQLVEEGRFRDDLYYRLCVLQLTIPPLRERIEDIFELANYFIKKKNKKMEKNVRGITCKAINRLMLYNWPGNVRQLENIIEKMVVLCAETEINEHLVLESLNEIRHNNEKLALNHLYNVSEATGKGLLKQIEEEVIKKVLEENGGNRTLTAKKLGINVTTLWRKLKALEQI
ncbi:MAG: sigma 54-interacting transcriptional regulator [Tepidanaerobacteraceae bacterium]|jgi:PAS domain S-box-containing protein